MKSKFVQNVFFWLLMMPILVIILLPMVSKPESFLLHSDEFERNQAIVGVAANKAAIQSAQAFHGRYMTRMCSDDITSQYRHENEAVIRTLGRETGIHKSNAARCQQVVSGIYRMSVGANFILGVLLFTLAAFVDGWTLRTADAYEFGYQSPLKFHIATHAFIIAIGSTIGAAFLPITFDVLVWPFIIVVIALTAWFSARNYQLGV